MNTTNELENAISESGKLQLSANDQYYTGMSNILVTGRGKLTLDITRPPVKGMPAGYLYIYEGQSLHNGKRKARIRVKGNDNLSNYEVKLVEGVDFSARDYIIGYGPTWTDDDVTCIAATARISSGQASDYSPTTFTPLGQTISSVSSFCSVPNDVFQVNTRRALVYLREGNVIGQGNVIHSQWIDRNYPRRGVIPIKANLKYGTDYNVGIYMYSNARFVAGYTFSLGE